MTTPVDEQSDALAAQARVLITAARDEALPLIERVKELENENAQLQMRVAQLEEDHRNALSRVSRAEATTNELSAVSVVCMSLLDAAARGDVAEAIGDIVNNVVGSEEYALYGADLAQKRLTIMKSLGTDERTRPSLAFGEGRIGLVAETRLPYLHEGELPAPDGIAACVPFLCVNELVGVLVIFNLLPQKTRFASRDRQILELISAHGGLALRMGALAKRRA